MPTPLRPQINILFVHVLVVYMLISKAVFIWGFKGKLKTPFHGAALKETGVLLYTCAYSQMNTSRLPLLQSTVLV